MLTPEGSKDKTAVAVLGSCGSGMGSCGSGMGSCSVLGFRRRLWQYLPSCVVNDWIYLRYMLIYYRRINRVERYIWRKYILTAVIDSATKCSVL